MDLREINQLITLNQILKEVCNQVSKGKLVTFMNRENTDYDEYFRYYRVNSEENLYVKAAYETDSYDENDTLTNIEFVQAVQKTVTTYKKITNG